MDRLIFVDLDDTLFCTVRKTHVDGSEPVAFAVDGSPRSYMTPGQRHFFEWLARDGELIPTTGRSTAALNRVRLRFGGRAICSHGGVIHGPDGRPDLRWTNLIFTEAAACRDELLGLCEMSRRAAQAIICDARVTIVTEGNVSLYISVKHNQDDSRALAAIVPALRKVLPTGWQLLHNDNNIALLPAFLGKERAVAWILGHLPVRPSMVVGVGDGLSDVPFLGLCDYIVSPSRSQLFAALAGVGA